MPVFSFIRHTLTELFGKTENLLQLYKQTSTTFYASNDMTLKRVEKKKVLRRNNHFFKKSVEIHASVKWLFIYF